MSRTFKKAENNHHLAKLIKSGLSVENIAGAFGVSAGALYKWVDGDPCPYWTKIAAEGIARRLGSDKQAALLIRCPKEQEQTISKVATSLGATVTPIKL